MVSRILSKVAVALALIISGVFYGLGVAGIKPFTGFNLSWAATVILWAIGLALLVQAFTTKKEEIQLKKGFSWLGISFILGGALLIINAVIENGTRFYIPIIVLAIGLAALISTLVSFKKKWDQGDNQKEGYMNYYERKAALEKEKVEVEKEDNEE
ncbi:hypothetical protein LJC17_01145 [Acholeplasma sp. OttesenSCG-928-E16]|nr:hypothetical protein [Acholeplasma sp. OttesenSCG-928-E16]